jgi:hypothetical protein
VGAVAAKETGKNGCRVWQNPLVSFIRSHPFWTLLIVTLVLMALSYVLFVPGHGSGGMDLGPIQPDK